MKSFKKITAGILFILLLVGTLSGVRITTSAAYYNNLNYVIINDNSVGITGLLGEAEHVVIPEMIDGRAVVVISGNAFYDCGFLESIEIPESVNNIGNSAFAGCRSLKSIVIPSGVTSIARSAFSGCESLESVQLPNNDTYIGLYAFSGCRKLKSITIPEKVTLIDRSAFSYCDSLEEIVVDENNKVYDSRNNCNAIINTSMDTLVAGCAKTIIPKGVKAIHDEAFNGIKGLSSINIPVSVESIGQAAFICENLTDVYYEGSETDRDAITVFSNNGSLLNALWHYNAYGVDEDPSAGYKLTEKNMIFEGDGLKTPVTFNWGWALFDGDPLQYSFDLAFSALILSQDAYNKTLIQDRITQLGFNNCAYYSISESGLSNDNFLPPIALGSKKYTDEMNREKTVVVMAIRGTGDFASIVTDLSDGAFNGFVACGQYARGMLFAYCNQNSINIDDENTSLFVVGHSLGGATAGRLAVELQDYNIKAKTFIYTFAPARYNLTTGDGEDEYTSENFPYVFNHVNSKDIIPQLPPWHSIPIIIHSSILVPLPPVYITSIPLSWSIGKRAGLDLYFDASSSRYNNKRMEVYGSLDNDKFPEFLFDHDLATYLYCMLKVREDGFEQWTTQEKATYSMAAIRCPVDVQVLDSFGNVIGSIEGDNIQNPDDYEVILMKNGDDKYVYLPKADNYTLKIIGTAKGKMQYSLASLNDRGEILEEKQFSNVVIEKRKIFKSEIKKDVNLPKIKLLIEENENVVKEVRENGDEILIQEDWTIGDVNGDNKVNAKDLTTLAKHVAKITNIRDKNLLKAADVNKDGSVNSKDLTHLAKYVAKIISKL